MAAGHAENQIYGTKNLLHPAYCLRFLTRQRMKILHIADIVLHLHHVTYARKNHHNPRKTGGKTNYIAGKAPAL